jgi:hypothetical protein
VKLTLTSSDVATLVSRYAAITTPMRPDRPHIPSLINLSKSHPQTKNV